MKDFKRVLINSLITVSLLLVGGCGKKASGYNNDSFSFEHKSYEEVSDNIGQNGGDLSDKDKNISINIPEGALSENTNVSAQYVGESADLGYYPQTNFLGAVTFGPSGTTFNSPVEVSLKLNSTPKNSEAAVFCFDEMYEVWDYVTKATIKDGVATFDVNHFSRYEVLDITPDVYLKYVDLVYEAVIYNKEDSWITETYRDFLINEKHVMDYYQKYDGLFYEASGLEIFGEYEINERKGDIDVLCTTVGESNRVGNRYGVSNVGGLFTSTTGFKKDKEQTMQKAERINVTVLIDYKMIKPLIELSAEKTKLKKGETVTVNVYCHYLNPTNYFPENRDFDLPYYPLTLPYELVHLKTDKKELVTNGNARTSFKVTSKDAEAETVKVMFYVEGPFGEYSAAYMAFQGIKDNSYYMEGHISEVYEWNYDIFFGGVIPYTLNHYDQGSYRVEIDYDFSGRISWDSVGLGIINGSINVSGASARIVAKSADVIYTENWGEVGTNRIHYNFAIFDGAQTVKIYPIPNNFPFTGMTSDPDGYSLCYFEQGAAFDFVEIQSSGGYHIEGRDIDAFDGFSCSFTSRMDSPLILNGFECRLGSQTISANRFKETTNTFIPRYSNNGGDARDAMEIDEESINVQTVQTITITKERAN